MDYNDIARLARIAEANARIANLNAVIAEMQAANKEREMNGYALAYSDDAFANAPCVHGADLESIRSLIY